MGIFLGVEEVVGGRAMPGHDTTDHDAMGHDTTGHDAMGHDAMSHETTGWLNGVGITGDLTGGG